MDRKFLIATAIACLVVAAAPTRAQGAGAGDASPSVSRAVRIHLDAKAGL